MKNRLLLTIVLLSAFLSSRAQIGGDFNPESPSDPGAPVLKYQLSVVAEPVNSGSFNIRNERLEVGSTNSLWANPNSDFVFKCWMMDGKVLSTDRSFDFVMPDHDVQIIGQFEYNPVSPANPNKNYWNKLTGEVIVDEFTPGNLYDAVSKVTYGSDRSDVQAITVAGIINSYDFSIAGSYSNCSLLDLSRVAGVTEVPSSAFYKTKIESVYLPACIEKVGSGAFSGCSRLSSITLYAMTPPTLERDVFNGVPDGLVVYVPIGAIGQYQDSDDWNKFALLPIQEDICSINVSLPKGSNVSDFAKMWLELINTKNGQRVHYIITDRTIYTFANIIKNTSWNVLLRNERGDVFGKIDNVEVKDEDVSVSFASLTKPQTVSLAVQTPDGKDVTGQAQITWTDGSGNYIAQGTSLSALPVGYQLNYSVALSQDLAVLYGTPKPTAYTLRDGRNSLTCKLEPIKQVQITGKVKDATTGMALGGAVISASQTFSGKYMKTVNGKADSKGVFSLTVANVPTTMAFAARDHINQTVNLDNGLNEINDLGDVVLRPISGTTITIGFNYTAVDGETQNWYSDYQNVGYTLYNKTRKRTISDFSVQYPQIVLLEEVSEGDVLELTAESKTQSFMPVKATATVSANQTAEATFNVVELGQLQVEYAQSGNVNVVASLYDSSGKLLKTYDYQDMSLTVSNLADGKYTLVSMGSSQFFNSVYDLAQLPQTGLKAGTDYVQNKVTVKSGKVTTVNIDLVPKFDESKFYYTGDNTSFTANKQSIVVGNYLTLTGHVDFKPAYEAGVSNVQMVVDLPESCEFVANSVMVGNSTGNYTLNGHQLTIPIANYFDRVRFCVIPTKGGDYSPSAYAKFRLNGKTITQPIGSVIYTAKDLSITVASTVSKTEFSVSGMAARQSSVEIYDNGMLVAQTEAMPNGSWQATCTLNDAYNLSDHAIYAIIHRKDGVALQTETRNVTYDKDAVVAKTVFMTFYNAYLNRNVDVLFDLENGSSSVSSYSFNKTTPFTFIADLSNNEKEAVNRVYIHVYTSDDKVTSLPASYDANLHRWVAVQEFTSRNLPVNVSVTIDFNSPMSYDEEYHSQLVSQMANEASENESQYNNIADLYTYLDDELTNENHNIDRINELISQIISLENEAYGFEDVDPEPIFRGKVDNANSVEELMKILPETGDIKNSISTTIEGNEMRISSIDIGNGVKTPTIKFIGKGTVSEELDIESLVKEYNSNFFSGNWENVDLNNINKGIVVLTSSAGCKIEMNFYDVIEEKPDNPVEESEVWLNCISDYLENLNKVDFRLDALIEMSQNELRQSVSNYHYVLKAIANLSSNGRQNRDVTTRALTIPQGLKDFWNGNWGSFLKGLGTGIGLGITAIDNASTIQKAYDNNKEWNDLQNDIDKMCGGQDPQLSQFLKQQADYLRLLDKETMIALCAMKGVTSITAVAVSCMGMGLGSFVGALLIKGGGMGISYIMNKAIKESQQTRRELKKQAKDACCLDGSCDPDPDPDPDPSPIHPVEPILDPSGYVYEAVASNRLQGVTATVFQKVEEEDMYGDVHDVIVKWDAEAFGQINPEITDPEGNYAWDVPQGLWQVKFEKEGYETTYSEWLPVPPPQLDINIAMTQNRQPEVKSARAFKDAVELEFDKYMQPELLTTENITVMSGNKAVEGTIKLLNEEVAYEGAAETFASKVRFNAVKPFDGKEVTLMVSNRVKSYAGIRMQDNFSQQFTVEEEVSRIDCKEGINVVYGQNATISVAALPASASAGKTLRVKSSSAMILSTDAESLVLDKDGRAEINVHGELPGTAALTFSVDGYDLTTTKTVNVVTIIKGDVNGDGEVNAADIVILQNYLSDQQTADIDESAADADGDGSITTADIPAIVAIILNKR